VAAVAADVASDVATTEAAVTPIYEQARAEYDKLSPAAQGRLHQLLNDIETGEGVVLAGLHGMFGAK
jgi:hypothetical protein